MKGREVSGWNLGRETNLPFWVLIDGVKDDQEICWGRRV